MLFMLIDWNSTQSIRNYIPRPRGSDQIDLIPKAWLALDDNPRGIVLRAKLWRCLSKKEQQEQTKKMQLVNKNTQQMKRLKGNLDMLQAYRKDLIEGDTEWDDIAEEPTEFLDSLSGQRLRAAAGASPMAIITADIKDYATRLLSLDPEYEKQKKSRTTATRPQATATSNDEEPPHDNSTTPTLPPPEPPQVTGEENRHPNASADNEETSGGPTVLFTSRASDAALRNAEAEQVEQSASSGIRRARGVPCERIASQCDSVAYKTTDIALKKAAMAADTIFCPRRAKGQPQRRVVLIEINKVKDTTAYGGNISDSDCRRENKSFTVVGPESRDDFCDFIKQVIKVFFKHPMPKDGSVLNEFYRDHSTGLVLTGVEKHIASRKVARKQPPKKPCSAEEAVAKVHAMQT